VPGGVHVVLRRHDLAGIELEPVHAVARAEHLAHLHGLAHVASQLLGVVEEDLVVDRPLDLEGGEHPLPAVARGRAGGRRGRSRRG